jgi:hypothetical protein
VQLRIALGVTDHGRMPARLAQGSLDADVLQLVDQPLACGAAMVLVGGIGGDGRNLEPLEQAFQGRVEVGIDFGENLVELGHGAMAA